jgi:hypothetical protein
LPMSDAQRRPTRPLIERYLGSDVEQICKTVYCGRLCARIKHDPDLARSAWRHVVVPYGQNFDPSGNCKGPWERRSLAKIKNRGTALD